MSHDPLILLKDVQNAVSAIETILAGRTFSAVAQDVTVRSAIYWQFAIIGEALSRLRHIKPEYLKDISESDRIIGFRNQILHGYEVIDHEITSRIVETKIPILKLEIAKLIGV